LLIDGVLVLETRKNGYVEADTAVQIIVAQAARENIGQIIPVISSA